VGLRVLSKSVLGSIRTEKGGFTMKKIEGLVVYYDDGSRERLSAQELMERFFGGFVDTSDRGQRSYIEPEKTIQPIQNELSNVSFVQGSELKEAGSMEEPSVIEPEKTITPMRQKPFQLSEDDKIARAANITVFPFGGIGLKGESLLECVINNREFMEKVAKNTKGKNAALAKKIQIVLDRNPRRDGDYDAVV
jgi:hypothetical protein